MKIRSLTGTLAAAAVLVAASAFSQNVTGVITGTVKDPAGSVVPNAQVTLTNEATRTTRSVDSNNAGVFVFPSVMPGAYTIDVSMAGFRSHQVRDIGLTANERRSLGDIVLQVGQVQERVEVTAEITPVQTASSERAGLVAGSQLLNTAIRGRDFVALLSTLPGIYDANAASREVSKGPGAGGLSINGGRSTSINFSLDGVQNTDTGSNSGSHNQPNMDAVAEVKVLTSNYQAEHGRNSSGTINVIVKSGTQDFHGSGFWFYRHEGLYANNFFSNRSGTPRPINRINNAGYTIGGPVYIPGKFNSNKEKLFFFFSQEYVRRQNFPGVQWATTPTALERNGDFSNTFDLNGAMIPIKDPTTGQNFPGNVIPKSRINQQGLAIINFFPLPNYTEADPALQHRRNYRSNLSGSFPRRQDLLRVDYNISSTLNTYFRVIRDNDDENWPYANWTAGSHNYDLVNTYRPQRGRGAIFQITKIVNSTTVNDFTMGASTRGQTFNPSDPSRVARSLMGNIGQWYPHSNESGAIPNVSFGGVQSGINSGLGNIPYTNENPVFSFIDNFSKLYGTHSLKFGIYIERMRKDEVGGANTRGAFDFGRNTNNPFDSNYAFSNALLGNFNSYSEGTFRPYSHYRYTQVEWYAQDSWRIGRRLSLELGLRFYSAPPAHDDRFNITSFDPSKYDASAAAVLIRPGLQGTRRVGVDPRTDQVFPLPYIGLFVPGSGDYASGMVVGGKDGFPGGLYETPTVALAPRVGFSLDPFGNGKTAIRGGWGLFYDRPQGNVYSGTNGQPPVAYTPTLHFGNLNTFLQSEGAVGPSNVNAPQTGKQPLSKVMNFSFGVQREVGFGTVLDAAYVGSLGRNLLFVKNINAIPMYARFDPANADITTSSRGPLQDNFLRPYLGLGNINVRGFGATSNYHSLQVSVNRRMARGMQYGLAYTFSKALGVASSDFEGVSPYFSMRERNYGPLGFNVPHMLVINYAWNLPNPVGRLNRKALDMVFANWQVAGITSFLSGTGFTPGFSTSDGQDITGSSEGARIMVTGDPRLPKSERTFDRNFKTEAFGRPARGDFGNAGVRILRGPGVNNWDISVSKRMPLGEGDGRYFQLRGEFFNAWNHTQFSGMDTTARFNPAGQQINSNFGRYTGARDARKVQLSLRFMF
jgi:hypothetical protein